MKKSIFLIIITFLSIISISCIRIKNPHYINLFTRKSPSEMEVIINMTEPVEYKVTKTGSPPSIILSFPGEKIISTEKPEIIINKGPVKKVKNEYFELKKDGSRQLNLLIIELNKDLPYKVSHSGSSIIVKIKDIEPSVPEKEKIEIKLKQTAKKERLGAEDVYLIGPGDVLKIEVWKQTDISRTVVVNNKGYIRLPPIRKISVMGLTVLQTEEKLMEQLSKYLIDPIVFVTIEEYNSWRVVALGELATGATGMYTLKRKTTLVNFIGRIGGPTDNADIYHIKLIKKNGQVFTYNLKELINNPKKSFEVTVSGGDTVYIPPLEINRVYVLGEVKSPRTVPIKEELSLVDAITAAGGPTQEAVTKCIIIARGELGSQRGIKINLDRILKNADVGQNIMLEPGDIIYVPQRVIVDVERFLRLMSLPLHWYFWFVR